MPTWYRWAPQIVFISSSQPVLGFYLENWADVHHSTVRLCVVMQPLETWAFCLEEKFLDTPKARFMTRSLEDDYKVEVVINQTVENIILYPQVAHR